MKIKSLILMLLLYVLLIPGCRFLENINGYDLSACSGHWDVCWELFWDNKDIIDGDIPEIPIE